MASEAQLSSDIYRLRREIAEINSENSQLEREIDDIVRAMQRAENSVSKTYSMTNNTMSSGKNNLIKSDNYLTEAIVVQDEIVKLNEKYKKIENAYKTIRKLNGELKAADESNRKVNRVMIALIDYIQGGIISKETVFKNIEKIYPMTRDYYLSAIMFSIAAWLNNKKDVAQKAIEQAMQLDEKATTLFFFLFSVQQKRYDAASKWFEILKDIGLTNADGDIMFLIILFALNKEKNNNADFNNKLVEFVDKTKQQSQNEEGLIIVEKIHCWMKGFCAPTSYEYVYLKNYVAEYDGMLETISRCKANVEILKGLKEITKPSYVSVNKNIAQETLERYILESKSEYGKDIQDKIAYQEAIIANGGEVFDALHAKERADYELNKQLNFKEKLIDWLMSPEGFEGKENFNNYAYNNLRNMFTTAYTKYVSDYSNVNHKELTLKLPSITIKSNFTDIASDNQKVAVVMKERQDKEIKSSLKRWKYILYSAVAILFLVLASVYVKNIVLAPIGFCLFGASICCLLVSIYRNIQKKASIIDKYDGHINTLKNLLATMYNEHKRYKQTFEKYDNVSDSIYKYLAKEKQDEQKTEQCLN